MVILSISKCYVFLYYKDSPAQSPCIYVENIDSAVELYNQLRNLGEHENHKIDYLACGYEYCTDDGRAGSKDINSCVFA